jgi:hypothetical protein
MPAARLWRAAKVFTLSAHNQFDTPNMLAAQPTDPTAIAGGRKTETVRDALGRATEQIQPSYTADSAVDSAGNVSVYVDDMWTTVKGWPATGTLKLAVQPGDGFLPLTTGSFGYRKANTTGNFTTFSPTAGQAPRCGAHARRRAVAPSASAGGKAAPRVCLSWLRHELPPARKAAMRPCTRPLPAGAPSKPTASD